MTARAVCDASAVVALLVDGGATGTWATEHLTGRSLLAPHLVAVETANILRRLELASLLSRDQAAQAHADLLDLAIEVWPYDLLAERTRQLPTNLTTYDASYVALAEAADAPFVTLDRRLATAPGPRCEVMTPPG